MIPGEDVISPPKETGCPRCKQLSIEAASEMSVLEVRSRISAMSYGYDLI
jgi:hypothetical protein